MNDEYHCFKILMILSVHRVLVIEQGAHLDTYWTCMNKDLTPSNG